jgi:hypothetical protein
LDDSFCSLSASGVDTVSYALRPRTNDAADEIASLARRREVTHRETGEVLSMRPGPAGSVMVGQPVEGMRLGVFPGVGMLFAEGRLGAMLARSPDDHSLAEPARLAAGSLRVLEALDGLGLDLCESTAAVRRLDLAAELRFDRPADGLAFLRAMGALDVPRYKRDVWLEGSRVETVYWRTPKRGVVVGRLYDKGVEAKTDPPGARLRLERQLRYAKSKQRTPAALSTSDLAAIYRGNFEALMRGSSDVIATGLNGAQKALLDLVETGDLTPRKAERMLGTLVLLERFGRSWYEKRYTAARRERELRELGILIDPDRDEPEPVPVGDLLEALVESFSTN